MTKHVRDGRNRARRDDVADTTAAQDAFPDPDSLIDRELILKWLYSGLFWLVVTPSIGVTISSLFNYPDYLGTSQYLTFGRLRPLHVNGVIWGAFSTLFIGLCHYIVPRLCGVRLAGAMWSRALLLIWNLNLLLAVVLMALGWNRGWEAGELALVTVLV